MFSIYGISGPVFQGTLETLSRLPPVARRGQATPVKPIGNTDEATPSVGETGATTPRTTTEAMRAYQSVQPEDLERGPLYRAEQIMQPQVITVRVDDDVEHAWHVLVEHRIHQAPVLDGEGRLVGIVSERNLLTALNVDHGQVRDVLWRKVSDVMSTPVVAADPATDIRRIAHVMIERAVDGVPIIAENGRLLGFISRTDILRAIVTEPPLSVWR